MYIPYNPCNDCKRKEMCNQCAFRNAQLNYQRALDKLRELYAEQGKQITILV